ncbi:Metallophosphoesterase [Minicystis rosea]|nr:Metallophosphoesterase [Minicystis rosea]
MTADARTHQRISAYLKNVLAPPGDSLPGRIQVRRFAGPAVYVGRMAPMRIAHLTDIHVGRVTPHEVHEAAVTLTNEQKPDLVVITGDFVCHSQAYLDRLESLVRGFQAPVVGVLGNHDHWSGGAEVAAALRRGGVEVLSNRHTVMTIGHERLQIVGLDDAYTGHADREAAVRGLRRDLPTIGLSHIAEEADPLWRRGVPFVLSGHTHAGQVTLARLHELAFGRLSGHRYVHGLYGTRAALPERGAVYVGAGIGASVVPVRLGDRGQREIAIFEMGQAPGSFEEHHAEQMPLAGREPSERTKVRRAFAVEQKRLKRERAAQKTH